MKKLIAPLLVAAIALCGTSCKKKTPADWVNPNIGGVAPLLTTVTPQVQRPNSMVRVWPVTEPHLNDRYLSDHIYGIIFNMPCYRNGYTSSIMATTGELHTSSKEIRSWYDHSLEEVHPWYHRVFLQDWGVDAEWTTTERTVAYRFIFPQDKQSNVIISLRKEHDFSFNEDGSVSGWEKIGKNKQYFHVVPQRGFAASGTFDKGFYFFDKEDHSPAEFRVGISYVSEAQAKANYEKESQGKWFESICDEGKAIWNSELSKIEVEGGTPEQKELFYTCFYRASERMVCTSEDGQYFSGFDSAVHSDEGRPFYCDDWVWDTYLGLHALRCIIKPSFQKEVLNSYARMSQQWGWVPQFPEIEEWGGVKDPGRDWHGEPMVGDHVASVAAEAIAKGVTDWDIEGLYEILRKNAFEGTMIPWRAGAAREPDFFYYKNGYFPALHPGEDEPLDYIDNRWEKRQAVSVTLDHSYDDWCLAQIAKYLGKDSDYEVLMARSRNYLNLWDESIGYFAPKDEKGEWIRPFDPVICDGSGGARSYFTEVGGCVHVFRVQHDIPKLIELMGGDEKFVERIDKSYNTGPYTGKWQYMAITPDGTGLQGLISAGNQPAFHIPWLYDYAGCPWKTQYRVRQCAETWFHNTVNGLSGDEDGGSMSSWYMFAALGFYPVNPVSGEYALASPMFTKATIKLEGGKKFVIEAPRASSVNKYVKSVTLNGEKLTRPFITHDDIMAGGVLHFDLVAAPCEEAF